MSIKKYIKISIFIGMVQFINALEFMIIAPVASFLLYPFHINVNQIGVLTAAYTFCAIFSGLIGYLYLDRFNKKHILLTSILFLGLANGLSICCSILCMIIAVRLLAGFFGGISLSLAIALIISHTDRSNRARALSIAMLAYPLVSVIGIPCGIWIAQLYGYQVLFATISAIIFICGIMGIFVIPKSHSSFDKDIHKPLQLRFHSILAASLLGIAQFPIYLFIPSLAIIMEYNMHLPADKLPFIFMSGGISSFVITKISGNLAEHFGNFKPIIISTIIFIFAIILGVIYSYITPLVFMSVLMGAVYMRLVATSIITSRYPKEHHRGGFSALQSSINNIGSTIAGFLSSFILVVRPDKTLGNIWILSIIAIISSIMLPIGLYYYKKELNNDE